MRTDALFKSAFNQCLRLVSATPAGDALGSELALARSLGVSRTTVRKVITALEGKGLLILDSGQSRVVARSPRPEDFFPEGETEQARQIVEKGFMELVLREDMRPGQHISTIDLAQRLGVSASVVREYLSGFGQFGLIEKQSNGGWVFRGFDREFARELSDVRELFELRAAESFGDLPLEDPAWQRLAALEAEHRAVLQEPARINREFSRLDQQFHELVNSVMRNRFFDNFNAVRSFIFHYHYQWNKADEFERNLVALHEHLAYILALRSRARSRIHAAALAHLRTARLSLIATIEDYRKPPRTPPMPG